MAKEKGRIEDAIHRTIHHADPSTLIVILRNGLTMRDVEENILCRSKLIKANLETVLAKMIELRKAVESGRMEKVREVLNSEIEFGRNSPNTQEKTVHGTRTE